MSKEQLQEYKATGLHHVLDQWKGKKTNVKSKLEMIMTIPSQFSPLLLLDQLDLT